MGNRIVVKAQDANIVKNEQTKPGCEIQIDEIDAKSLGAALFASPNLLVDVENEISRLEAEADAAKPKPEEDPRA